MKNSDPILWPDSDLDMSLRQNMQKNFDDSINILQTQWYQADLDQRYVMGDQDIWGLLFPGVSSYRRKMFNFNLTNGAIQTVSGYQRRNRKTSTVIPILTEAQKTSDQLTKCLFHVLNKSGVYQTYSDCFDKGALTQGLGFLYTYIDKTEDVVSGDIKKRYIDMKQCLFDPFFRKHDMSDCRYWWMRTFFGREEAAVIYQEFSDEILALPRGTYRDDKFYYMPEVYQIQFPNLIAFDEYWYATSREATYLIDKETEECQEFTGDDEQLRDLMRQRDQSGTQFRKLIAIDKRRKPTVRRSIILNDRVMIDEANPYGIDKYPVVPCLGYFNPDTPYYAYKFRGIARDMRDAQYLFNRRKVADLDILESQQQGIKMKKGALITPDDSLNQGNGRVLVLDPAFNMQDVEKMNIDPPSPVMLQMEEMLKGVMSEISGVTPEMMGQDIDDKAGIISLIRQGATVTRLQTLFDQFDEFQRLDGDLTIEIIQKNWTYGKVKQVIGEEPTPEFDNKLFFKYGCKVAPGVLTESQKQLEAQQLIYLRKEMEIPVPTKRILDALVLQNKDELIKDIIQAEEAASKQAEERAKLEMQQLQVDNETKLSYAESQRSLANERTAKIQTDQAVAIEKIKRSKEEEMGAILNLVKAVKELQGIDITNLMGKVEILQALNPVTQQEEKTPMEGI